jgi:hypothetical protein
LSVGFEVVNVESIGKSDVGFGCGAVVGVFVVVVGVVVVFVAVECRF